VAWLDEAERRLDNLSSVSDSVRDVRIQLEQMKVVITLWFLLDKCFLSFLHFHRHFGFSLVFILHLL